MDDEGAKLDGTAVRVVVCAGEVEATVDVGEQDEEEGEEGVARIGHEVVAREGEENRLDEEEAIVVDDEAEEEAEEEDELDDSAPACTLDDGAVAHEDVVVREDALERMEDAVVVVDEETAVAEFEVEEIEEGEGSCMRFRTGLVSTTTTSPGFTLAPLHVTPPHKV